MSKVTITKVAQAIMDCEAAGPIKPSAAAVVAPAVAAWLIERYIGNVLHYYSADAMWPKARCDQTDWRPDVDLAIRFVDERSALMVLERVCENQGRVAEHMWIEKAA